jgi:hypothetical protein
VATASVAVRLNAITGEFETAFSNATRTVSGFERTFGNAASSIQGHQQAMNRAFAEFSGDKLTRDAAALAKAIQNIGGASKLTEAEQRKVNASVTEAIAKYAALGQQAPASLTALANATRQLSEQQQRIKDLTTVFGGREAIGNANAMVAAVGRLGGAAKLTATEQRTVNAAVTEAITKYAALGQSAPQSLRSSRRPTSRRVPSRISLARCRSSSRRARNSRAFKGRSRT